MSSSEEVFDADMYFQFHEIQLERPCLEREKLKLGCREMRVERLYIIRSIRSGEVAPTSIDIYRQPFQDNHRCLKKDG